VKQSARSLGAAGYLVHPIHSDRILGGLQKMAAGHRGRRFSRLDRRLHVAWQSACQGFTRSIGRGGLFVRAENGVSVPEYETLEIALPEFGEKIEIETHAVFRVDAAGTPDPGVGLRFHGFPNRDEARWIAYLTAMLGQTSER
jgi:Tfp pilus assembly protein PilZ